MKITILLLADEKNSIHPRSLPWKDSAEPWICISCEDPEKYEILYTDVVLEGNVVDTLFKKVCEFLVPEVSKNHEQYFKVHKFKTYNNLKRELKEFLLANQGQYLTVSGDLGSVVEPTLTKGRYTDLNPYFEKYLNTLKK